MSIKRFCDSCHKEVEENVLSDRVRGKTVLRGLEIEVEVHCGTNGTWNKGELCRSCLWAALDIVFHPPQTRARRAS